MSCSDAFQSYALRAIGLGERALPRSDISICEQVVLIGSGMIWNVYFAVLAVGVGFFWAVSVAMAMDSRNVFLRGVSRTYVFLFRGSPLFIQFFFAYEVFVTLPKLGIDINLGFTVVTVSTSWLTKAWLGALIVLFLNTAAYAAQIFHGALQAIPEGELEAADACGMGPWRKFLRIILPSMLRLAWPSYTNEAIFLFHATVLVYFSSFPAWRQKGDALYYASYFAEKTFNPFVAYPIIAAYYVMTTVLIILGASLVSRRLNRHLAPR
ncbi:MAG: ABC transporter permease subunit [Pseudomonadota bacterium]